MRDDQTLADNNRSRKFEMRQRNGFRTTVPSTARSDASSHGLEKAEFTWSPQANRLTGFELTSPKPSFVASRPPESEKGVQPLNLRQLKQCDAYARVSGGLRFDQSVVTQVELNNEDHVPGNTYRYVPERVLVIDDNDPLPFQMGPLPERPEGQD